MADFKRITLLTSRQKVVFNDIMDIFKRKITVAEDKLSSKIEWKQLTHLGQLETIVQESEENPVIIFKYSTRCGISRMVLRQFENEFNWHDEVTPYFLDLLQHRDISNAIENKFGVRHESPQIILIKNGKAVYDSSHDSIDAADLKEFIS